MIIKINYNSNNKIMNSNYKIKIKNIKIKQNKYNNKIN